MGMFVGQRVKTITHLAESLSFVQNRIRRHRTPASLKTYRGRFQEG